MDPIDLPEPLPLGVLYANEQAAIKTASPEIEPNDYDTNPDPGVPDDALPIDLDNPPAPEEVTF